MREETNREKTEEITEQKRPALRTYMDDTAKFIKDKKVSLLDLAAMKDSQGSEKTYYASRRSNSPAGKIAAVVIVVFLALVGGFFYFYYPGLVKKPEKPTLQNPSPPLAIINVEAEEILAANNLKEFQKEMERATANSYKLGDLVYLPLKKDLPPDSSGAATGFKFLNSNEFLELISAGAPFQITDYLENIFLLGLLNLDRPRPLLVLEAKKGSFDNIFSGMLQWEKAMPKGLSFLLNKDFPQPNIVVFKDALLKNNQVRVGESSDGELIFYTILNRKYIIITDSRKALEEIMRRFELFKFS